MSFIKRILPYSLVERRYLRAGSEFGDAVSCIYMGECIGFKSLLNKLADWEREYARRGYRTVSINDFEKAGGWGASIDHLLGQKREQGEEPVFHAQIYKNVFLGKVKPAIDIGRLMATGEIQYGQYVTPSTEQIE